MQQKISTFKPEDDIINTEAGRNDSHRYQKDFDNKQNFNKRRI